MTSLVVEPVAEVPSPFMVLMLVAVEKLELEEGFESVSEFLVVRRLEEVFEPVVELLVGRLEVALLELGVY